MHLMHVYTWCVYGAWCSHRRMWPHRNWCFTNNLGFVSCQRYSHEWPREEKLPVQDGKERTCCIKELHACVCVEGIKAEISDIKPHCEYSGIAWSLPIRGRSSMGEQMSSPELVTGVWKGSQGNPLYTQKHVFWNAFWLCTFSTSNNLGLNPIPTELMGVFPLTSF